MEAMREIELKGHIIDSFLLPKIFDKVMDMNGEFEILQFEIGRQKTDTSYARLMIKGKDKKHLENIISELHRLGAQLPEAEDVVVATAPKDKVVPKGFYSTTNHSTYVKIAGEWKRVVDQKMDSMIVVRNGVPSCVTLGHIKKGDKVVVGKNGIRIVPPERPRGHTIFEFMGGQVSSERPSQSLIKQIAEEILEVKASGGKVVVVGGPAIIHTGGAQALAELIRNGFVDAVLAGNALAVHDIEYNLYGTSLGMDLNTVELAPEGHKHHIYAISEITRAGSIKRRGREGRADRRHHVRVHPEQRALRAGRLHPGRRPAARRDHGHHDRPGHDARAAERRGPRAHDGHHAPLHRIGQLSAIRRTDHLRRHQPGHGHKTDGPGQRAGHRRRNGRGHLPAVAGRRAGGAQKEQA